MDEDYFASAPPTPPASLDDLLLVRRRPARGENGWVQTLGVVGRMIYAAGLLLVVVLPIAGILMVFEFIRSLPF